MNISAPAAAGMADADIYAFSPLPPPAPPTAPQRRRRWPWLLLVGGLVFGLLALVLALSLVELLGAARDGMSLTIDGEPWPPSFVDPEHALFGLLALAAAAAVLLVVMLVVPMVVLLVLAGVALLVALVVGSGLVVVVVVAALALSPLWLAGLLIWLLVRDRRERPAPPAGAG